MTERKAISKGLRFEVFKRDGFKCMYCGATPPAVVLHVDHMHPVALGGDNEMDNLVTACAPCNLGKAARDLKAVPQSLADRASETAEREEQLSGFQAVMEAKRDRIDDEVWRVIHALNGEACHEVAMSEYSSIKRFVERLGVHQVLEAADIARGSPVRWNRLFRYFCGVCWNRIRALEGDQ